MLRIDILDVSVFLQLFNTCMLIGVVLHIARTQHVTHHVPDVGKVADEHETTYEIESVINDRVFEREVEHDERIAQLIKELGHDSTPASELHPGVKNLPHHTNIRELPDVEETE